MITVEPDPDHRDQEDETIELVVHPIAAGDVEIVEPQPAPDLSVGGSALVT